MLFSVFDLIMKCSFSFQTFYELVYLHFLCLSLTQIHYASCEWFSSLGQMEDLINDEVDLVSSLQDYITAEEEKLSKIKKFVFVKKFKLIFYCL